MNFRAISTAVTALALSFSAVAQDTAAETTVKLAQEQLHILGFYTGRIDGDLSGDAQAALTQFQLSRNIPASGALDDETIAELGIKRETETQMAGGEQAAAAGGSAPGASPEQKSD